MEVVAVSSAHVLRTMHARLCHGTWQAKVIKPLCKT